MGVKDSCFFRQVTSLMASLPHLVNVVNISLNKYFLSADGVLDTAGERWLSRNLQSRWERDKQVNKKFPE